MTGCAVVCGRCVLMGKRFTVRDVVWVVNANKRMFWFRSFYVLKPPSQPSFGMSRNAPPKGETIYVWETAKIVIKEQLKKENQRKLFEKFLFMTIRPEFNNGGCLDVLLRCFGGFASVFRCFQGFRFGVSGFSTCCVRQYAGVNVCWCSRHTLNHTDHIYNCTQRIVG